MAVTHFRVVYGTEFAGALLYSYDVDTTDARDTYPTYDDAVAATNANDNPVVLDSNGIASVWLSNQHKMVLKDSTAATTYYTWNDTGDPAGGSSTTFADGSAASPSITFTDDTDNGFFRPTTNAIGIALAGAEDFRFTANTLTALSGSIFVQTDGIMFLGDTANGKMTLGWTANLAGNDDEIGAFKSSDIGHTLTDRAEADSFGTFKKRNATNGGMQIDGYAETTGNEGLSLIGSISAANWSASVNIASDATGIGAVSVVGYRKGASTDVATPSTGTGGADYNLLSIWNGAAGAVHLFKADGDIYLDGAVQAAFDEHDDMAVADYFDVVRAHAGRRKIDADWRVFLREKEDYLIALGILGGRVVGKPAGKRGLVNITQLQRLHNGAIRQIGRVLNAIAEADPKLAAAIADARRPLIA